MTSSLRIATLLAALAPTAAFAHPHIFAEARLEVVAGKDGTVSELRHIWRFDEIFSSSVVLDFDKNTDLKLDASELAEVGETVRESLGDFSYYTNITDNGKTIGVVKPDVIHVDYKDNQILMFFSVKPATPIPMKGKMTFSVYDPTFYSAIDFATDDDMVTIGDAFKKCKREVVRPDPDQVMADNKANLTEAFFNDPAGNDLSKMFATRLEITC